MNERNFSDLPLGGERRSDNVAVEEGWRREGASAADGVHADSVPARQQVPLRREGHRRAQEGRRLLRPADHRPLLNKGRKQGSIGGTRTGKREGKTAFWTYFLIVKKLLREVAR